MGGKRRGRIDVTVSGRVLGLGRWYLLVIFCMFNIVLLVAPGCWGFASLVWPLCIFFLISLVNRVSIGHFFLL